VCKQFKTHPLVHFKTFVEDSFSCHATFYISLNANGGHLKILFIWLSKSQIRFVGFSFDVSFFHLFRLSTLCCLFVIHRNLRNCEWFYVLDNWLMLTFEGFLIDLVKDNVYVCPLISLKLCNTCWHFQLIFVCKKNLGN